ncbi:MAG TPA: hypothetical protein VN837_19305 [Chloroflexota bacterium]|nr:hypothetical protein [Chloroflexota bacterium]
MAADLSLPEAQSNLTGAAERFIAEAEYLLSLHRAELAAGAYQQAIASYARVSGAYIRACDQLLDLIKRYRDPLPAEVVAQVPIVRAGRMAAYMELQELVPDEAAYWTVGNQARIQQADRRLTREMREQVLSEIADAYAIVRADTAGSAEFDAERATWNDTLMDGLEDDPYPA